MFSVCTSTLLGGALLALALAAGAQPAPDRPARKVFAHYMVCIPRAGGGATVEDYQQEIREAQARGIDGFALDCGGWSLREPHYKARTLLIYEAARQLGTGFLLMISADYATDLTLEETCDMVVSFKDHPNQFRWGGKPVLSTFCGEGADNVHGQQVIDCLNARFPDGKGGRNVVYVPYYYPPAQHHGTAGAGACRAGLQHLPRAGWLLLLRGGGDRAATGAMQRTPGRQVGRGGQDLHGLRHPLLPRPRRQLPGLRDPRPRGARGGVGGGRSATMPPGSRS